MNMDELIEVLEPHLAEKGIIILKYSPNEIKERFPRFLEMSARLREFIGSDDPIGDSTFTSSILSIIQLLEEAETSAQILQLLNELSNEIVELNIMYYEKIEKYSKENILTIKEASRKKMREEFTEPFQKISNEFATK